MSTGSSTEKSSNKFIVSLDIGASFVRALLFDAEARQVEGYGARLPYFAKPAPDGVAEIDPNLLAELALDCLDELHRQVRADDMAVAAVAANAGEAGLLGIGSDSQVTVPILPGNGARAAQEFPDLRDLHTRTGRAPLESYWPANLCWLLKYRPVQFAATKRWLSFPDYLCSKLFVQPNASTSIMAATGLFHQDSSDYDAEALSYLNLDRSQLADPAQFDQPMCGLRAEFKQAWPAFDGIPWFPALTDGVSLNFGCGGVSRARFALTMGSSGGMRVLDAEARVRDIPSCSCLRADNRRFLAGVEIAEAGAALAKLKKALALPKDLEARLENAIPGDHGLDLTGFFGDAPARGYQDWRDRIAPVSTDPVDVWRAALESISLRFRQSYRVLAESIGSPHEIVASGASLLKSPAWTQMVADAIGRPVIASTEAEPCARGAALWALERIGAIDSIAALPASFGATFEPRAEYTAAFNRYQACADESLQKIL